MSHKSIIVIQVLKESISLIEYVKGKPKRDCKQVSLPIKTEDLYGDPVKTGQEIIRQLANSGIKTKDAIVVPQSSEVLIKDIVIPPLSDKSMLKGIINSRMQRELKLAPEEMALDFTGNLSSQVQNNIILSGLQTKRLYSLQSVVDNANLNLEAVVPGDAALFQNQIDVAANENIIYVDGNTAKIVIIENGGVKYISTVVSSGVSQQLLSQKVSGELKRNPILNSAGRDSFRIASKSPDFIDQLKVNFGAEFKFTVSSIAYSSISESIAEIYFSGKGFELNFTANHFTEKVNSKMVGNIRKAVIVCGGLLLLVGWFFYDWNQDKFEINDCNRVIEDLESSVKNSKKIIDKVNKAKQWCSTEAYYSECLKHITQDFPDQSNIWANSLALDKDFIGVMTGSATSKQRIESTLDKLIANPSFSDVKLLYIRQAGKSTTELSFALQFRYNINIPEVSL